MSAKNKDMALSNSTPDSTTKGMQFSIGDEVLMQRKDGTFYLGTIVEIDFVKEVCLVKFGDNTQTWSVLSNLTKLSTGLEVACVKCKSSEGQEDNDIIVCDGCSRGYHQQCHSPGVKTSRLSEGGKWECSKCCEVIPEKRALPPRKSTVTQSATVPSNPTRPLRTLPYQLSELDWDQGHKVNKNNKYCYCGGPGRWFLRMIQCGRCRQWFHSKCIENLDSSMFFGDRYYMFVCSVCNVNQEFIRRLEMKWVDLVHLSIFHLTLVTSKKYLHVDEILKFINSHWSLFPLPPKVRATSISDRRDLLLNILTGNRNRFKCSREVAKRTTMWGLKRRIPPPPPPINLPPDKPLTDASFNEAWSSNTRLNFLHLPKGCRLEPEWDVAEEESLPGLSILHIEMNTLAPPEPSQPSNNAKSGKSDLPPTPPSSESNAEGAGGGVGVGGGSESSGPDEDPPSHLLTLNSIIPPPRDFDGANNPFHSLPLTLAPLPPPPVKTTKRRLSEKDIRITSNGEIKRRRVRRRKQIALAGRRDGSLNGNSLSARGTPHTSPLKNPPPAISLEQLKTSLNHFFGAVNRIQAGEKFNVKAKRISADGKVQYLLDWDRACH